MFPQATVDSRGTGAQALRVKGTDHVVETAAVESFATLPQLLSMPLHVINAIDQLTVTTVHGTIHGQTRSPG